MSRSGSSALSKISIHDSGTLDNHLLITATSPSSPHTLAIFEKPRSMFSSLLASIQNIPQNLTIHQCDPRYAKLRLLILRTSHDDLLRILSTTGSSQTHPGRR